MLSPESHNVRRKNHVDPDFFGGSYLGIGRDAQNEDLLGSTTKSTLGTSTLIKPDYANGGATYHPKPNDRWEGYLLPENRYTLNKLQALDPNSFAPAVMAQRARFKELRPSINPSPRRIKDRHANEVKIDKNDVVERHKTGEVKLVPVHEYILGHNIVTPSFVAKKRRDGIHDEVPPSYDTLINFGDSIEEAAKKGEAYNDGGVYRINFLCNDGSSFNELFNDKVKGEVSIYSEWTEPDMRSMNPLTLQTEIGFVSITRRVEDATQTIAYSIFDDDNGFDPPELCLHRQVWFNDPNFVVPSADQVSQRGTERNKVLAGIIENTYKMERAADLGYADVGSSELGIAMNALGDAANSIRISGDNT